MSSGRAFFVALCLASLSCKTDGDCVQTCECQQRGLCGARWNVCKATEPEHCSHSDVCKTLGQCSVKDGKCIAATDADCSGSADCQKAGLCRASGGRCVK